MIKVNKKYATALFILILLGVGIGITLLIQDDINKINFWTRSFCFEMGEHIINKYYDDCLIGETIYRAEFQTYDYYGNLDQKWLLVEKE